MNPRSLLATLLFVICTIGTVAAQELKERELRPAFNFTTIQMPVEIVSIKLKGKEVAPGQKVQGNDEWVKGLSFTLKNISDKPIAYVAMGLRFDQPPKESVRVVVFGLSWGVDYSRGEPRSGSSPLPLQPGETIDLVLTEQRWPNFLEILGLGGIKQTPDVIPYYVQRVSFEDDRDIIWEGGYLKRRDPTTIGKFDVVEAYKLPAKR